MLAPFIALPPIASRESCRSSCAATLASAAWMSVEQDQANSILEFTDFAGNSRLTYVQSLRAGAHAPGASHFIEGQQVGEIH
jgi:hypothetical protein